MKTIQENIIGGDIGKVVCDDLIKMRAFCIEYDVGIVSKSLCLISTFFVTQEFISKSLYRVIATFLILL